MAAKKDQRTRHPYDPKKNKRRGPGRPREYNHPPKYKFVMGLAEVRRLAVAHITDESEVAEKRDSVAPARPRAQTRI